MTLGERIKKVRKDLDLTQQELSSRIGTTANVLTNYETGRRNPSSSVINNICKTFNVNETWLRTGEGEMFRPLDADDELTLVFNAIAASDDELIKRIIRAYWKLDDWEKAAVKKLIDGFAADGPGVLPTAKARTPTIEAEKPLTIEEQVELYRQHLLLEKERETQALSVKESGAG